MAPVAPSPRTSAEPFRNTYSRASLYSVSCKEFHTNSQGVAVGAWNFVGRVGGLAVALGVGAAVFNYSAVASADTAGAGSETSSARSATSSAGASQSGRRGPSGASSRTISRTGSASTVGRRGADSAPPVSAAPPRASIALPRVEDTTGPIPDAVDDIPAVASPVSAVAKGSAPAAAVEVPTELPRTEPPVASVPALEPAPATGDVTALYDPAADPFADGGPTAPVGSPLEWTLLAYTRRELSDLSLTTTVPAAVPRAAATVEEFPPPPFQVETNICTESSQTCTLILGPSGVPIPSSAYVDRVMYYFTPYAPDDTTAQVVFTPEGLYPITGVKSLPLDTSVDQGMTILSDTLALVPAGMPTAVFGYSQSSIISSLLQDGYQSPGSPYPPPKVPEGLEDSITFVVVANEVNPNGGFLSRFPDLNLPALGIPFYGAAPAGNYPTISYAREYDGFADYPRYPMNFLSVLNATLGIVYVHTQYAPNTKCESFCLTKEEVDNAIALPTTDPTQKYYFIPTENLPLLQPLRAIPLIGNPIADLIQPVLKVIVDLGYADWAHGFGTEANQPPANVLVPFGVFPDVDPLEVLGKLVDGVQQGISDFIADFGPNGSIARELASFTLPTLSFELPTPGNLISTIQDAVLAVGERISGAAAALYAALLPTADIINSIVTMLPAYNVDLFLEGVKMILNGKVIEGLVNAIGLPVAASVGLITTASLVGVLAWAQAAVGILSPGTTVGV